MMNHFPSFHRPGLMVVLALLLMAGPLAGSGVAQITSAQLEQALERLNQSHRGFVPGSELLTLAEFRESQWQQLLPLLDGAIAQSSGHEQQLAMQLKAAILTSLATKKFAEAEIAWAELSRAAAVLLIETDLVSQLYSSAAMSSSSDPQVLERLDRNSSQLAAQRRQLQERQETLEGQSEQKRQEAEKTRQESRELEVQSQQKLDDAFLATGEKRHELQDQAADLSRRSAQRMAEADIMGVQADRLRQQAEMAGVEMELLTSVAAQMRDLRTLVENRHGERNRTVTQLASRITGQTDEILQRVEALVKEVSQQVLDVAGQAEQMAAQGTTVLGQVMPQVPAAMRTRLGQEQLAMLMLQVDIQMLRVRASGEFAATLAAMQSLLAPPAIAGDSDLAPLATAYRARIQPAFADMQTQLRNVQRQAVDRLENDAQALMPRVRTLADGMNTDVGRTVLERLDNQQQVMRSVAID